MTLTSKITAACAFDAKLVDAEIDRLRAADIPFNQTFGFSMGARFYHTKDQQMILALAAQLENTVGALEKSQKALASGYSPQQDAGQQVYSEARHSVTQTLTDVRKFMEGLGHE